MADSLDEAVDWLREKAAQLADKHAEIMRWDEPAHPVRAADKVGGDVAQVAHYLADLMMRVANLEAIVQGMSDKMAEGFNVIAEVLEDLK